MATAAGPRIYVIVSREMVRKTIELRAHTERVNAPKSKNDDQPFFLMPDKWSGRALIIDCETLITQTLSLLFGYFCYCRLGKNGYQLVQEGFFYADNLDPEQRKILEQYG
jgi:hypothetical protein